MNRYILNDVIYHAIPIVHQMKSKEYQSLEQGLKNQIEILNQKIQECHQLQILNDSYQILYNWQHKYIEFENLMDQFLVHFEPVNEIVTRRGLNYLKWLYDYTVLPPKLLNYLGKKFPTYQECWKTAYEESTVLKGNLGIFYIKIPLKLTILDCESLEKLQKRRKNINMIKEKMMIDYGIKVYCT